MPELPEVETVKNVLKRNLVNLKIEEVIVNYDPIVKTDLDLFKTNLLNEEIIDIKRYGKWLVFETTNYDLVSHLRMEGKYFYTATKHQSKHDHIIFKLSNGYYLTYNDVRKFGVMFLVKKDKLFVDTPLKDLGVEPFSKDLTVTYLLSKFKGKRLPIKTTLLDQSIITGIGNIYADEILFKSLINPLKKATNIKEDEAKKIIENTKIILNKAIKLGGTTIRSYTSSLGVMGSYQDNLLVHTKTICPLCKNLLICQKVGGRSTYYCPSCQVQDE